MKNILTSAFFFIVINSNAQSVADSFYKQAKQYDSLGNVVKAVEYYTKTIEADQKFLNAYFNRGSILAQQKKYQEALNDFKNFDKISPNDFEVQYLMAACYYYLGDKGISFELVNKSLKSKEDFFDALKLRGTIYLEKGEHTKAIEDLNKALLLNKNASDIYFIIGSCYEKNDNKEDALNSYYTSEKLGYNSDELFNNIGNMLSQQKDYTKALIYFGKAISINSNNSLYYYNEGVAFYALGFKQSAIDSWKKAKNLGYNLFNEEIKKMID